AVWNQLANLHGHTGDPKLAFDYYAKAIELDPTESVYYHNFGTTVYLFRKDAMEHYGITELQVFEKALDLYAKAMQHDPTNFLLAADVAQTYYGIRPLRTDDALRSWTNALSLAQTEIDREGVYIHFARIKLLAGRFDEARAHLNAVTNEAHAVLKDRVAKSLEQHMHDAQNTNAPPAESPPSDAATPANKD
ncbi:MAG: tetratricopeptide repeat protein, partial [Verrucomicrobia bacterium]